VLFVVQATATMGEPLGTPPRRGHPAESKLDAAASFAGAVINELLGPEALELGGAPALDVGVLAYGGGAGLDAPLPGATAEGPLVPLSFLAAPAAGARVSLAPGGTARPAAALAAACRALQRWLIRNPTGVPPLVIHLTDGEGCDAALARASRSLSALASAAGNVLLMHCVLSGSPGASVKLPTAATEVPDGPWRPLWQLSSPMRRIGARRQGTRAFCINSNHAPAIARFLLRNPSPPRGGNEAAAALGDRPWQIASRPLWLPKGGNTEDEWEDAFAVDAAAGLAAVSDGAGSGIFSGEWARLLTRSLVEARPSLADPDAFGRWLGACRERLCAEINVPSLRFTQQKRFREAGAGATLLALRLGGAGRGAPANQFTWSAWAVGDSCLFWVRENRLWATFPAVESSDFRISTNLLRTLTGHPVVPPLASGGMGRLGDFFLLATDATAQILMRHCEEGREPDWEQFWQRDEAAWRDEVLELRRRDEIVDDDCTLLAVRLVPSEAGAGASGQPSEGPPS